MLINRINLYKIIYIINKKWISSLWKAARAGRLPRLWCWSQPGSPKESSLQVMVGFKLPSLHGYLWQWVITISRKISDGCGAILPWFYPQTFRVMSTLGRKILGSWHGPRQSAFTNGSWGSAMCSASRLPFITCGHSLGGRVPLLGLTLGMINSYLESMARQTSTG